MRAGTIPGLGWAFGLSPLGFMFLIWFAIFWLKIVLTAFDGQRQIVLDGWKAFRLGNGIAFPVIALAERILMDRLPAGSGGFWDNATANWLVFVGSVAVSAYVWFWNPLVAALKGNDFHPNNRFSEIYFHVISVPVGYWIFMPLLPITASVAHHISGPGWSSLSAWTLFWIALLVLAIAFFAYTNKLDAPDLAHPPAGKVLWRWGTVAVALCLLRYLPELSALLASSPTWLAIGP